jgi:phage-related protein
MKKKIIYYENKNGERPVEEFINNLNAKIKAKLLARIQYFEEHWHELRRPYVDLVEDGIYELRVQFAKNKIRVIYAYMFKDYIVLLHSFIKTTGEISENDKLIAKKRMYDFQIQHNEGRLKLKNI